MRKRSVGILIFDGVEVLDFAGPFEVFSRARTVPGPESRHSDASAPFRVFTVGRSAEAVTATGGLRVLPDHDLAGAPDIDVLVVPGGFGTRPLLEDEAVLRWLRERAGRAEKITSVCTGSALLARAGLLDGRRATTHWAALDLLRSASPRVEVEENVRWVDDGVVTSAGVAAGIDMALHVVETVIGPEVADETARYIDYPRHREGGGS